MPNRIFISYRRDDDPSAAARLRDGLAAKFGQANVFMDVDNLIAGQRFDQELTAALAVCDVCIAVIGPRWMDLLRVRQSSRERDYARDEIADALQRQIVVIPVRVGRENQLAPMPRPEELPQDIHTLALHHKHDLTHEHFSRDLGSLINAIVNVSPTKGQKHSPLRARATRAGLAAVAVLAIGYAAAFQVGAPALSPAPHNETIDLGSQPGASPNVEEDRKRLNWAGDKLSSERSSYAPDDIPFMAFNNLAHETVECSAYNTAVSTLLKKTPGQELLASQYMKNGEALFTRSVTIGKSIGQKQEAVGARYQLALEAMFAVLDGNSANLSLLYQKYGPTCKVVAENVDKRFEYWLAEASAKLKK